MRGAKPSSLAVEEEPRVQFTINLTAAAVGNPVSYSWNVNGDGFGDATGQTASLTWAQLEALTTKPIQDSGGPFQVIARATYANGLVVDSAAATLTVSEAEIDLGLDLLGRAISGVG